MEDLGKYLREHREAQHISIEELVALTRVPIRYIEAIEKNQFDQLPNQVSAKGFLRSYAACIGIEYADISEAFSAYKTPEESNAHLENQDKILSYLQVKRPVRIPFPRRIVVLVGVVILALLVFVGLLSNNRKKVKDLPPVLSRPAIIPKIPENNSDILAESEVLTSQDSLDESPQDVSGSGIIPPEATVDVLDMPKNTVVETPSSSEEEVISKRHILFLEAIEPSWVQVTIDDDEVREALLQENDTVKWKANKKFLLTLGNAGGVRAQLDGQDLEAFGPSGEVVHKEILVENNGPN